jgi:hypothetical protein
MSGSDQVMSTLQAQREIQEPVFGPFDSRRFGKSLGVNPLPAGARLCNFDFRMPGSGLAAGAHGHPDKRHHCSQIRGLMKM